MAFDLRLDDLRCIVLPMPPPVHSPREMEIAKMVARGQPTKRIPLTLEDRTINRCKSDQRLTST